jgi:putative heme iron utilization protein
MKGLLMPDKSAFETSSGLSRPKIEAARDRILGMKTMVVAVSGNTDTPEIGVSPFIRREDGLYIYTSHLSQHVRDLLACGVATCLLCADESDSQNIWARNRLKFTATATEIARDNTIFASLCDDFAATHGPTMDLIRNFTDFHMLRLDPDTAVLVLGFAKAFRLSGPDFEIVAHLSEA